MHPAAITSHALLQTQKSRFGLAHLSLSNLF
jgi:hypothetical protein